MIIILLRGIKVTDAGAALELEAETFLGNGMAPFSSSKPWVSILGFEGRRASLSPPHVHTSSRFSREANETLGNTGPLQKDARLHLPGV
jgi:hypothetical protein